MESALAFFDGDAKFLAEHINRAVVRHLEIVDTCHDGGKVIIGCIWGLAWFADDGEHGSESFEACIIVSRPEKYSDMIM